MTIRTNAVCRAIACAGLLLSVQFPAWAGTEFVGGWEGSSSRGYGFAGPMVSFGARGPWSWVARGSLSYLYYDLQEADGITEVRSPGQAVGVALRYSGPRVNASFGPGYEIRQTTRRSAARGEEKESERGLSAQGDVFFQATPRTNLSAILSYGAANQYFWGRVGAKRQLTNFDYSGPTALHAGIELTLQGNDESDAQQVGGVFEVAFPKSRASLQFRSGRSRIEFPDGAKQSENYFGIGLYRGF